MREAYEFFADVGMIPRDVLVQVPRVASRPTSAAAE
jgi:hypothetical protein